MPSQFFGLSIAYTGLLASNAAMNTTANNIANVQTEGYSRQKVDQQAANALRVFQKYGCAGAGVETIAIERIRDEFYDGRYWYNNARVGEYSQKQYYMQQIETYFDDNGKNAGFKTVFDQLMITGIQELLKNPDAASTKTQFMGYAGALTEYFNGVAGNMEKLQKDVNQEIKLKVDEINSLAGEIANLNKQINTIEIAGTKANELRDRRSLLLDQLSEIVDVDVQEIPIKDSNNPDRETGAYRCIVRIAAGQTLVDGAEYKGLECVAREKYEKVNQTDIDGLYDVYWEDGQKFNLYSGAMGGALKGLVQMRDGNNAEYFNGTVTETGVDGEGRDIVTVQVSKAYLQDLNKCNLSDCGGIINLGNKEFYYDSWSYQISFDDQGKEVHSYTFTLSGQDKNPKRLTNDREGKLATIGPNIAYQGIPYYMNQMNEWVRTFAQKFNDIVTGGYDSNSQPGIKMFTGNMITDDAQYDFPGAGRYDLFAEGQKLMQEVYTELAPELLVLTSAAQPIYDAYKASTTYTDAIAAETAKKQAAKEKTALDEKVAARMKNQDIKTEVAARAPLIQARPGNAGMTLAQATKQAETEVEAELRNGTYDPANTGSPEKVELNPADPADKAILDKIAADAASEAEAKVDAEYRQKARDEAEKQLKTAGEWDKAIEQAKKEVLAGNKETDPEKKKLVADAVADAIAEISRREGVPQEVLKDIYSKTETARTQVSADNPGMSDEDVLEQALKDISITVGVGDDSYYRMTAMNFSILAAMELDPSRLANRYDVGDGVEQSDLLKDLKDLAINKDKMSFRGCSASEFLQCVLSDVALNSQRANTFYQSFTDLAGTIDTQRISISGVDEDEEAMNLVKYQNGYNLASKMIQTLTEIYDRLILETGV